MTKATDRQVGGNHYASLAIQPMEYALKNDLNYAQANSIEYITRYKSKGGIEDLRKAIHCIELLIEHEMQKGEESLQKAAEIAKEIIDDMAFKHGFPLRKDENSRIDIIGQNGNDAAFYEWALEGCQRGIVVVHAFPDGFGNYYLLDVEREDSKLGTDAPAGRYLRQGNGKYRLEVSE